MWKVCLRWHQLYRIFPLPSTGLYVLSYHDWYFMINKVCLPHLNVIFKLEKWRFGIFFRCRMLEIVVLSGSARLVVRIHWKLGFLSTDALLSMVCTKGSICCAPKIVVCFWNTIATSYHRCVELLERVGQMTYYSYFAIVYDYNWYAFYMGATGEVNFRKRFTSYDRCHKPLQMWGEWNR